MQFSLLTNYPLILMNTPLFITSFLFTFCLFPFNCCCNIHSKLLFSISAFLTFSTFRPASIRLQLFFVPLVLSICFTSGYFCRPSFFTFHFLKHFFHFVHAHFLTTSFQISTLSASLCGCLIRVKLFSHFFGKGC